MGIRGETMKPADVYSLYGGKDRTPASVIAAIETGNAKAVRAKSKSSVAIVSRSSGDTPWPGEVLIQTPVPSMANLRLNRWKRAEEVKRMRELVDAILWKFVMPPMPVVVTFTRLSKYRPLDSDNLSSSCKSARDSVAQKFNIDDGSADYTWRYLQEKAGESGLRIKIDPLP